MSKQRLYNLDLLKIVASIGIVFHHYQQATGAVFGGINFFGGLFSFGSLVELFFMMSGFLALYNLRKNRSIVDNICDKYKRLAPSVILSIFIYTIIAIMYYMVFHEWHKGLDLNFPRVLTSFLMCNQGWVIEYPLALNNPTWYIDVLLLCFIFFYTLSGTILKKGYTKVFIAVCGFAVVLALLGAHFEMEFPFFYHSSRRGYAAFFMGVILCYIYQNFPKKIIKLICCCLMLLSFSATLVYQYIWYILVCFIYPAIVLISVSINQIWFTNSKWINERIITEMGGARFKYICGTLRFCYLSI